MISLNIILFEVFVPSRLLSSNINYMISYTIHEVFVCLSTFSLTSNEKVCRDEIQGVRRARDPIEHVRMLLVEHGLAESQELKQLERKIKKQASAPSP